MTRGQFVTDVITIIKEKKFIQNSLFGGKELMFSDTDFLDKRVTQDVLGNIGFVKESNRDAIKEAFYASDTGSSYDLLIDKLYKEGLLSTEATVHTDAEGSSLIIDHQHFLHWFRGYYFQVSYTLYGRVDSGTSSRSITRDLRRSSFVGNDYFNLIYYSHLCEIAFKYDKVNKIIKTSPTVINEFMQSTFSESVKNILDYDTVIANNFDVSVISNSVQVGELPSTPQHKISLIEGESKRGTEGLLATLYYNNEYVGIQLYGESTVSYISIPSWEALVYDEDSEYKAGAADLDESSYYKLSWEKLSIVLAQLKQIILTSDYIYNKKYNRRQKDLKLVDGYKVDNFNDLVNVINKISDNLGNTRELDLF